MVKVYVRDVGCNKTLIAQTASKPLPPHAYSPAVDNFIDGEVSSAPSPDNPKLNLQFLALNPNGQKKVNCNFNNGSFSIEGLHKYELASSVQHGAKISFEGFDMSQMNWANHTGDMRFVNNDVNNVKIKSASFLTDAGSDSDPPLQFNGSEAAGHCTLDRDSLQLTTIWYIGQPCSGDPSAFAHKPTVRLVGEFHCTLPRSGGPGSVNLGSASEKMAFGCSMTLADKCPGAPGGAGGGQDPIQR